MSINSDVQNKKKSNVSFYQMGNPNKTVSFFFFLQIML